MSQSAFDKPMNLLSHRVLQRIATETDVRDWRIDFRDSVFDNKFWGMNASYYGIKSFYNQLTPQPYAQFEFMLLGNVPHLRAMMGARYVLCGPAESPTDANAKQMVGDRGLQTLRKCEPDEPIYVSTSGGRLPPRASLVLSRLSKEALITILKLT